LIQEELLKIEPKLSSTDEKELNDAKSQKVELLRLSAVSDLKSNNHESALEKMGQVIELKPGDPRLYMARAEIYANAGDKDAAREDLTTAVDIGQKIGDMQSVSEGRQMIEALDSPPELEVIKVEETDITPSPTATP